MSRLLRTLVSAGSAPAATLDEILITPELARRPARASDYSAEVGAFRTIARSFAGAPQSIFQTLVDVSLGLCCAGTAGLSLLEKQPDGSEHFRWVALAGALAPHVGVSTPRGFSPCGACWERGAPVLLERPARRFTYLEPVPPPIAEALIVPVREVGGPGGTLWAMSHDESRRFDAEDVRQLTSLAAFTAAGIAASRLRGDEHEAREVADRTSANLRRSNADLEDFSHIIAHDLKEPARGIRHHVACLREDSGPRLGDEAVVRLLKIDQLAERMIGMLGGLLEYSRAGHGDLAVAETDLGAAVAVVIESLGARIEEEGAKVTVLGPLPTVRCDSARIGEVFANLIGNGLKYNRSEPKRVEIGWVAGEGGLPTMYVRDNGIGVGLEDAKRLFRVFTRLRDAESFGDGSGSGLAIAQKIIGRHGGRIWINSVPGAGTTFFFTLGPGGEGAEAAS